MDLGSKSRHIIMPMSSSFEEKNLHAEQQAPGGGNNMAKGSNNVIANNNLNLSSNLGSLANPVNNNANHNLNLSNNLGSLPDHFTSSTARPALDNHSHVNTRQAEPDNLIKPSHDHTNTDNVNNDIDDDNNLASSGITRISNNEKNNSKSTFPHRGLRYRECLKNHAANMGGYAVDGCGEFMPSGEEGSLEALKCAACGCHRNFHRRETNGDSISHSTTPSNNAALSLLALPSSINTGKFHTSTTSNNGDQEYGVEGDHSHSNSAAIPASRGVQTGPNYTAAAHIGALLPHLHHHHHHQYMHHAWTQQGGGKLMHPAEPGAHHAAGMAHVHHGAAPAGAGSHGPYAYHVLGMGPGHTGTGSATHLHAAGKRFRTKFTMEQREKMFEFSEKVGWRIQKQDEAAVQQFCAETGVKRHVLKVWMHNNKNLRQKIASISRSFQHIT